MAAIKGFSIVTGSENPLEPVCLDHRRRLLGDSADLGALFQIGARAKGATGTRNHGDTDVLSSTEPAAMPRLMHLIEFAIHRIARGRAVEGDNGHLFA